MIGIEEYLPLNESALKYEIKEPNIFNRLQNNSHKMANERILECTVLYSRPPKQPAKGRRHEVVTGVNIAHAQNEEFIDILVRLARGRRHNITFTM